MNCKKGLIIVLAVVFSISLNPIFCQTTFRIYTSELTTANNIIDQVREEKGLLKGSPGAGIELKWHGDTLEYNVDHPMLDITLQYSFNYFIEGDTNRYCDYQKVIHSCHPCAQHYLHNVLLKNNYREWKEDTYLSPHLKSTILRVKQDPDNADCIIMEYKRIELNNESIRTIYKSLKPYRGKFKPKE